MSLTIGLLGGAFDPIHHGHLRMALDAYEQLGLDRVHFIPTANAPHRSQSNTGYAARCEMVELALADHNAFICDRCEGIRAQQSNVPSYSVDTIESVQQNHPDARIIWLLGSDAFVHFNQWHRWQTILEIAELGVLHRPYESNKPAVQYPDMPTTATIHHIMANPLAISSTQIRDLLHTGRSPQYLLPSTVYQFIKANPKLYAP